MAFGVVSNAVGHFRLNSNRRVPVCSSTSSIQTDNPVSLSSVFWDSVCKVAGTGHAIRLNASPSLLHSLVETIGISSVGSSTIVRREPQQWQRELLRRGGELQQQMTQLQSQSLPDSALSDPATVEKLSRVYNELGAVSDVLQHLEEDLASGWYSTTPHVQLHLHEEGSQGAVVELRQAAGGLSGMREMSPRRLPDEEIERQIASMRRFVDEIIVPNGICPYTASSDRAAVGPVLKKSGYSPGRVLYHVTASSSTELLLKDFFDAAERLLRTDVNDGATTLLAAPNFHASDFKSFAEFTQFLQQFCLKLGLTDYFGLVSFHPDYDRALVNPRNGLISGHLPPLPFLKSYVKKYENEDLLSDAESLAFCSNFARRSAQPMFNILRVEHLHAIENDGSVPKGAVYARNAVRLSRIGATDLSKRLSHIREHGPPTTGKT